MLLLWLSCQPQWGSASMWKRLPPCPQSRHGDERPDNLACLWVQLVSRQRPQKEHLPGLHCISKHSCDTVVTLKSQGQECTGASAMAPLTNELKDCFNRQVARP